MSAVIETPAASLTVIPAIAGFTQPYERTFNSITSALLSGSQECIANAFAEFGDLRPVHVRLPATASKEEKRDVRDDYLAAVKMHQRALKHAFCMARDAGAVISDKFAGSVSSAGAVSIRQTVTAKIAAPKRTMVRL